MKTNTIKTEKIQAYLNDCLNMEAYEKERTWNNFLDAFNRKYGFMVNRIGKINAMIEYLQGLPSGIDIAFYYVDIFEVMKKWGLYKDYNNFNDLPDVFINNMNNIYWNLIAVNIFNLAKKEENKIINDLSITKL